MEEIQQKKVSALVLCTNEKHFLEECLHSLSIQTYRNLDIYLLDNNSGDGSADYVRENFPSVHILSFPSNLGYAKANNLGLVEAFGNGSDFSLILNSDIKCDPSMVDSLVSTYNRCRETGIKTGLIQPVILLYDEKDKLNTMGNAIHYMGFGYCKDYKKNYDPLPEDREIISVSGAAMLVSREYYQDIGLINEDFFIYNEDQNYSWRGLLKGYRHFVSARAIMLHKYRFKSYSFKFYHSEKNRLMILLENYERRTLILMFPALFVNECFLLVHSLLNRWFLNKLKSLGYIFSHMDHIRKVRKEIQSTRLVRDQQIVKQFEPDLDFAATNNFATRYLINPLYRLYYKFLLRLL